MGAVTKATAPAPLTTLLDPDRLAVAGTLAIRAMTTSELVETTGRDQRTVLAVLGDLRILGIVRFDGEVYALDLAALRSAARELSEVEVPMDAVIGFGMTDEERAVLGRYFSGRVLVSIPAHRSKRRVVLQRLALEFDVGRHYLEREVNDLLGAFHPDWSSLRRGLVEEGFLDREPRGGGNLYWRSGGRVTGLPPVSPPPTLPI